MTLPQQKAPKQHVQGLSVYLFLICSDMIRSVLLFVILFTGLTGFCSTPIDSLKAKVSQIEKVDQKRIDSLQRELQYYKVKEDYYSDALSNQATRFSLIVGSLLALAALVSWRFLTASITAIRKEFTEETIQINKNLSGIINLNNILHYKIKRDVFESNYFGVITLQANPDLVLFALYRQILNLNQAQQALELCPDSLESAASELERAINDIVGSIEMSTNILLRNFDKDSKDSQKVKLVESVYQNILQQLDHFMVSIKNEQYKKRVIFTRIRLTEYFEKIMNT